MKKIISSPENTDQALDNFPKRVKEALNDLRISLEDLHKILKDIPQSDIELLENLGIHEDHAKTLTKDQPPGSKIIQLHKKRT